MGPRILLDSIESTQSRAVAEARAGAPAGTRIVARRQSHGIGRSDRRWASPSGGLYLSLVLPTPSVQPSLFPLAIGAEISRSLAARYGVSTWVKWPNDLVVVGGRRPRKLAGILSDTVAAPWGPATIVGVGVNVAAPSSEFPPELRATIVGLAELLASSPDPVEVEGLVVGAIERAEEGLRSGPGRARLLSLCRQALYGIGRRALVDGQPAGVIRGLGDDGALLLVEGPTETSIHAGSLLVEEPA